MIRNYKLFTEAKKESKKKEQEFDLLESISLVYSAIIKVVEIHEKHYYNDNKIISNEEFKSGITKLLNLCIKFNWLKDGKKQPIAEIGRAHV